MEDFKRPKRIKPLDVKIYIEGKCFICGEPCETYAHHECCIAYDDHKEKKYKEINKED